ncbi:ABC transporter permease [Streptomyces sp. NPDC056296]|uniref:ABC transporter permease n=1 Tax=Streptomyces sp. NPDC056296 TaxID=3345775 RepID=UPI0035E2CEC6
MSGGGTARRETTARLGIVVALVAGYELAARSGVLDRQVFRPISLALADAGGLLAQKNFWDEHLLTTLLEIVAALVLGTLAGFAAGVGLWRSRLVDEAVQPWLLLVYSVPIFALYPIFIAVLGGGTAPVVAVGVLASAPAVAINTAIGFRTTRPVLVSVARAYGLGTAGLIRQVYLPSAWPHVFSGMRLASSYSIVAVVGTEFLLSTNGLGHEIAYSYNNFETTRMYAVIAIVLVIAIGVVLGLGAVEKRLHRKDA